jgi:two-component system CheB/CheR fusion protein
MGAAIIENRNMMMLPKDNVKPAPWLEPVLSRLKAGGHDFSGYKVGTMQRRIERRARMAGHHPGTMPGYIERLGRDITELQTLANDLLINVTSFFRDEAVFATLTDKILPDLVQDHEGDGPIRLWSAGCSTGEEAWSLAILVLEEIARSRPHLKLQLFGTDLDPDAIAKARRGVYTAGVVERVSPARLERYFIADEHGWRITRSRASLKRYMEGPKLDRTGEPSAEPS